jgi:beta-lactamase regulating signal transducer with metallopeptidase domain
MALQQQQADNAAALAAAGTPMSDTTKAVIAVGVVGAVGVAAYLLTRKRGR